MFRHRHALASAMVTLGSASAVSELSGFKGLSEVSEILEVSNICPLIGVRYILTS
jgi:hypothetical protein